MELNKDSWHYKFVISTFRSSQVPDHKYNNLCSYLWLVAMSFVINICIGILFIFLALALFSLFNVMFIIPTEYWTEFQINPFFNNSDDMIQLSISLWSMVVTYAIGIKIFKFNRKRKKEKRKNIFVEYIKAKKDKICPTIEWK